MASLFPRSFYGSSDPSFTPLFRLLDDFDTYAREAQSAPDGADGTNGRGRGGRLSARTFAPKFDVRETETAYELHGELPGIEREHVSIEFTEPQTLVVRGRVERSYSAGTPPAGMIEGGAGNKASITDGKESHKATVEDEAGDKANKGGSKQVQKHQGAEQQQQQQQPKDKYWVSERSVGEFHRTFSFPTRVDQDNVSASLTNGILTVTVPKAKKAESRKITVN